MIRQVMKRQTLVNGACLQGLQLYDVGCLESLVTFNDIKTHQLAFYQGLEPISGNLRVVCKNVGPVIACNEPITLGLIEPFYSSTRHSDLPPSKVFEVKEARP
jgi:hypothetical protein